MNFSHLNDYLIIGFYVSDQMSVFCQMDATKEFINMLKNSSPTT